MPIYHFIVDYTRENNRNSRLDTKSNIIVKTDNCKLAHEKVQTHLEARKTYTGNIIDYDVTIDWIEHSPIKAIRSL